MIPRQPESNLGRQLKAYQTQAVQRRDAWMFMLALAIPAILLTAGLWAGAQIYLLVGLDAAVQAGLRWLIPASVALAPAFILILRQILIARRRVFLHKNGLRLANFSRQTQRLLWKRISGISVDSTSTNLLGQQLFTYDRLGIFPTTGDPVWLDDHTQELPHLSAQIKARVYPLILPELRASLHSGQWLYFGAVRINRDSLASGHKTIAWQQIAEVGVKSGNLEVALVKGSHLRMPTRRITNLELLLKLISEEIII